MWVPGRYHGPRGELTGPRATLESANARATVRYTGVDSPATGAVTIDLP